MEKWLKNRKGSFKAKKKSPERNDNYKKLFETSRRLDSV